MQIRRAPDGPRAPSCRRVRGFWGVYCQLDFARMPDARLPALAGGGGLRSRYPSCHRDRTCHPPLSQKPPQPQGRPMSLSPPLPDPARILAVIPARLASTRLPRKVLRELNGQPLLAWVVEAALRCPQIGRVVVAADSEEVAELCSISGLAVPDDLARAAQRERPALRRLTRDRRRHLYQHSGGRASARTGTHRGAAAAVR